MYGRAWQWLVFFGFGLVFFVLTLVVVRWTIDFVTWSTLDSGWAQAIGSVLAILGAFAIANQQHRNERAADVARRNHDEIRRFDIVKTFATQTDSAVITVSESLRTGGFNYGGPNTRAILAECRNNFTALPPFEFPSSTLLPLCFAITRLLLEFETQLCEVAGSNRLAQPEIDKLEELVRLILQMTRTTTKFCFDQIEARK